MKTDRGHLTERHFWRSQHERGTVGWHGRLCLGRLQIACHIHRHRYAGVSDRWVFQPSVIYDRRTG